MKRILFAHQSTIPHYRIPFYEAFQRRKPEGWSFDVVYAYDSTSRIYNADEKLPDFSFPVLPVKTTQLGSKYCYQHFWKEAGEYDLIIVENALNNLTYPLSFLHKLRGVKVALWGHGYHRTSLANRSLANRAKESLKLYLSRSADLFFAYTDGIKHDLCFRGITSDKMFVVNNTIDIVRERKTYLEKSPAREGIRKKLNVEGRQVILFVGRLGGDKKLEVLMEAIASMNRDDLHIFVIGDGPMKEAWSSQFSGRKVEFLGAIIDRDILADYYVASDLYVLPGAVGLGPLQAACYDLPTLTIETVLDGPEAEYLCERNAVVLPVESGAMDMETALEGLLGSPDILANMREQVWDSVQHLSICNMADTFIQGIETVLECA